MLVTLPGIEITAQVKDGCTFQTSDGKPLHLAVIDGNGNVLASGAVVAKAVFAAAVKSYEDFWLGNGGLISLKGDEHAA